MWCGRILHGVLFIELPLVWKDLAWCPVYRAALGVEGPCMVSCLLSCPWCRRTLHGVLFIELPLVWKDLAWCPVY